MARRRPGREPAHVVSGRRLARTRHIAGRASPLKASDRKITVLAWGHSKYARDRASQLLGDRSDVAVEGGIPGISGAVLAFSSVIRWRPRVTYLVDVGLSTTAAALAARLLRRRIVLDTGDVAFELAKSVGGRSPVALASVWLGERFLLRSADHLVVRGTEHLGLVSPRPATHAPDIPPLEARPVSDDGLKARLGLHGRFVVGLVGSLRFAPKLGTSYGWDLIEALAHTPPHVAALIVGDGDGLPRLRQRATTLGVVDRCRFVGRVPPSDVPSYIGAMDVGISTQTNDIVGAVRTTGKLPLYLACGCPVLASDVGEARRLLGPLGWTVPYEGVVDRDYPIRLAQAISAWAESPSPRQRQEALSLARREFDPAQIRKRIHWIIDDQLQ